MRMIMAFAAAIALVAPAQLVLPAPTGSHPVGWTQLHLVDQIARTHGYQGN
jgi:hypothetical protein